MKTKIYLSVIILAACFNAAVAQTNTFPASGSVGIGTTSPDASSILEVKSSAKGMLIPRMTVTKRNAIPSPATGLLIFQTNSTPGFYYYNGTAWLPVGGANTSLSNLSSTSVNVSFLPDNNNQRNLGSTQKAWENIYFTGSVYQNAKRIIYADSTGNYFAGLKSGPSSTTAIWNTAVGNNSFLANTTGESNTAFGYAASQSNTTGNQNTGIGFGAMSLNTTGSNNTAIGSSSLGAALGCNNSVSIGALALESSIYGHDNTAIGFNAMPKNLYHENTAVGSSTLLNNTNGSANVAIGYQALASNVTGSYNTGVGYASGFSGSVSNTTTLGYGAANGFALYDNFVAIGNTSVVSIQGEVGFSQYSDGRIKDNIKSNVPGLAFINKLNPVTYNINIHMQNQMMKNKLDSANWKGKYDIEKRLMTGFVAQDVEKAAKQLNYDFSGVKVPPTPDGLYALTYSDFVVPLVKAVQELSKMNDTKDSEINNLEIRIEKLEAMMNVQSSSAVINQQVINSKAVATIQNAPNPFSNATTIQYILPQKFTSAKMIIADNTGNVVKQINLTTGKGSINFNAAGLAAGTYNYSLYVDGNLIAGKQMIKVK